MTWIPLLLGTTVVLGALAILLFARIWRRRVPLSSEEREDLAVGPMPPLQKGAYWSLLIGVVTLGVITAILMTQGGAAAYWDDDELRLWVVGIFIAGLVLQPLVLALSHSGWGRGRGLDERDNTIMKGAAVAQAPVMLITLGAWNVGLGQMFHAAGAIPMVYLYLMFGSVVMVSVMGQSLGVLVGYWMGVGLGES